MEVWDLDFKDRGWFSKKQTMLPKSLQNVTKKFFSGVHPRPQVQSERDSVERLRRENVDANLGRGEKVW